MPVHSVTYLIILATTRLYRAAWRALLDEQPGIAIVDTVSDAEQVAALSQSGSPTTVLIDQPSPLPSLAQQLTIIEENLGILFLVDTYELGLILPLLQAGATGCVSRDETVADLARAIIAVGRGEIALPTNIAGRALAAMARGETVDKTLVEPLSDRETEVLRLLAQGLTNKDMAQTLILSVRTIEAHLRNIFGKLGVTSRTEAALWATKHGYGPDD